MDLTDSSQNRKGISRSVLQVLTRYSLSALFVVSLVFLSSPLYAHDDAQLARGRYLATAGTCTQCHTVHKDNNDLLLDTSRLLAGGREFELPFGTVYSANITPDSATGIGSWTEAEVAKAIRNGVAKDGTELVQMPWQAFRGMAESDALAIAAYLLKEAVPVKNKVLAARLHKPREAIYAEVLKHADPLGPETPPRGNSSLYAEYLTQHVFGCAGCHGSDLAGGKRLIQGPSLRPSAKGGPASWTIEQIVAVIKEGRRPDGSRLSPEMPYATAFVHMTESDAHLIAAYIKSLKPLGPTQIMARPIRETVPQR